MKKLKLACLAIFGALFFCQCGVSNSPEAVSLAFMKAVSAMDFKTAKKLCTTETADLLTVLETQLAKTPPSAEDLESLKKETTFFKSATCTTTDDKSICYLCCKEGEETAKSGVSLRKIDGKWLVYIDKGMSKSKLFNLPNK